MMCQPRQSTEAIVPAKVKLSREQARTIAAKLGVSERTIWRRLEAGKLTAADLAADEEG